ncbi:hypothetical protein F442_17378 [Phytophthora nicotianae P10297]|uniref:Uncharacterized protein n=1 Tax=Phytophthora nicotianae P10297 TaxID=1317064 RepID=W2YJB8_PHYNI|nr:hypothetical protein F442_17378 [Phytophthora nicotianae P10297]
MLQASTAMETRQPRKAPSSPIKPSSLTIQPQEYVDTPGSSTTVSPAESCVSDVRKQVKPWERSTSVVSSVNSSESSEPLWEDDTNDIQEEEAKNSVMVANSSKASAQSLMMQTHMRNMRRRLDGLQRLVQEAAQQSRLRSCSQESVPDTQSHVVPAAEANEVTRDVADLQRDAEPAPKESVNEFGQLDSVSSSEGIEGTCARTNEVNDSRDDQKDSSSKSSDDDVPLAVTTLLNRIKTLQAQLKETTDEKQQLQSTVLRLEEENARLQAQTTVDPPNDSSGLVEAGGEQGSCDAENDDATKDHEESFSRLTIAIFGELSAFQMVMEEDLTILKNHERCQHNLHELWDTIRTLRTFVETYELERNALRIQRDDAIADADRADAENVKLASSSNPQQKIKYLQQVKKDNQVLRRKNRALNLRIAKQAAKYIREKNGCSLLEEGDTTIDTTLGSVTLDDTLLDEHDECAVRTGEEILRCMRDRSEILEHRLERLRLARQELPEGDDSTSEDFHTIMPW